MNERFIPLYVNDGISGTIGKLVVTTRNTNNVRNDNIVLFPVDLIIANMTSTEGNVDIEVEEDELINTEYSANLDVEDQYIKHEKRDNFNFFKFLILKFNGFFKFFK